jgi:osmotically-inducible protein OsmY
MRTVGIIGLLGLALVSSGCAFGYKKAAEAAMSPLGVRAQAQDQRLKAQLRTAVLGNQAFSGVGITPDVVMQCGFLVGFVDSEEQAQAITQAGQSVGGLRSLQTYLPIKPADDSMTSDLETKTTIRGQIAIEPMLVSDRYTIEVMDGVVVILGATMSEDERDEVGKIAAGTTGVKDVKNYLMVAEPPYTSFRPHLR